MNLVIWFNWIWMSSVLGNGNLKEVSIIDKEFAWIDCVSM